LTISSSKVRYLALWGRLLVSHSDSVVTERARHLRAHYALQSSDLRSRIERRINRIPMNLRKANMGELLLKYSEIRANQSNSTGLETAPATHSTTTANVPVPRSRPLPSIPQHPSSKPSSPVRLAASVSHPARHVSNDEIHIASDKENDDNAGPSTDIPSTLKNPKRVKVGGPTPRATSRTGKPTSVLSPKSHNSRTLPQSPIKDYQSPTRHQSYIARPTSPLKPASPLKTAASAATSAISASLYGMVEHAKRGAGATTRGLTRTASKEKGTASKTAKVMGPPPRPAPQPHQQPEPPRTISSASSHSNLSSTSASSTSTTVVKKGGRAVTTASQTKTEKRGAAATKTAVRTTTTATTAKKGVVAEQPAGRRVLRKRN
jgi:hypothetical protein